MVRCINKGIQVYIDRENEYGKVDRKLPFKLKSAWWEGASQMEIFGGKKESYGRANANFLREELAFSVQRTYKTWKIF